MIPDKIERNIEKAGEQVTRKMGIAEGAEHLVMQAIRRDIYSDPQKSIWREYCANTLDEHLRLDIQDKPFHVTFPNALEPHVKVRDFGRGLTEEQVFHFFGKLGASDKRDTDKLIGAFGFGCKVGHAYSDAFTVTSFKDGVKRVFTVWIGEDELGDVSKLGEMPTDEPNGVEIEVPVKNKDIPTFVSKGIDVIKYFPVKPVIKGLNYQPTFDERKPIIKGDNWRFFGSGTSVCLMGAIGYEIEIEKMGQLSNWESRLLRSALHIDVKIGEVNVTASRENLRMTDKTIAAIRKRLAEVKAEMISQTEETFKACKTLLEAKTLYYDVIMGGSGYAEILRDAGVVLNWNGEKISDNKIMLNTDGLPHNVTIYSKRYYRKNLDVDTKQELVCGGKDFDIYYDDTDGKIIRYKRRAVTLINAGASRVIILKTTKPEEFKQLTGVSVKELKSLQAVAETFVSNAGHASLGPDKAKRAKHQTKVFQLDLAVLKTGYESANSGYWGIKNVELKNGLYIPIDRFAPTLPHIKTISQLRAVISNLEASGIKVRLPIYGLKAGVDTGQLVRFDDWLKKKVSRIKQIKTDAALIKAFKTNLYQLEIPETELPNGLPKQYLTLYKKAQKLYNNNSGADRTRIESLVDHAGLEIEPDATLIKLNEEFLEKYGMMRFVRYWQHTDKSVKAYLKEKR